MSLSERFKARIPAERKAPPTYSDTKAIIERVYHGGSPQEATGDMEKVLAAYRIQCEWDGIEQAAEWISEWESEMAAKVVSGPFDPQAFVERMLVYLLTGAQLAAPADLPAIADRAKTFLHLHTDIAKALRLQADLQAAAAKAVEGK